MSDTKRVSQYTDVELWSRAREAFDKACAQKNPGGEIAFSAQVAVADDETLMMGFGSPLFAIIFTDNESSTEWFAHGPTLRDALEHMAFVVPYINELKKR